MNFKFDMKGMADLESAIGQDLKKTEAEANKAADKESTSAGSTSASTAEFLERPTAPITCPDAIRSQ